MENGNNIIIIPRPPVSTSKREREGGVLGHCVCVHSIHVICYIAVCRSCASVRYELLHRDRYM